MLDVQRVGDVEVVVVDAKSLKLPETPMPSFSTDGRVQSSYGGQ